MKSHSKVRCATLSLIVLLVLICVSAAAQGPTELSAEKQPAATSLPDPPQAQGQAMSTSDDAWQFDVAPYIWIPGVHGTVGALGHSASVHVSGSDLLSNFNGGFAGFIQARKNRWVIPIDLIWTKLATTQGIPLNDFGQTAARVELNQVIFSPKFGYRILDTERVKFDALAGIRYWHLGQTITLRPSLYSQSQGGGTVDGIGGGKFEFDITPKVWITAAGDAGAGGSKLDYQAVGTLNIQPKPKFGFFVGWRYLDIDYRGNNAFLYDIAQVAP